ncbi:TIGR01777 family oxidoreductase [Flavobacterium agrisoli]|uniref:TIGR01777 family oxidoreductase n=1 Tax=Flavobacterium agrisoli TaxID=2793066 RepID=A0A934PQU3_9FLAO|nr:TIGR01777 family oxidoreductase [Flavobacterium agrisoli]MBK0371224.1 TIGR01777 family oxidoreductase [Flavobacterium agrisoli]
MEANGKKNVLITGGSGFIGQKLTQLLLENGFSVGILSRSKRTNQGDVRYYSWDIAEGKIDKEALIQADYIVHLAGTNIAGGRWTEKRKKEILSSRIDTLQLLYRTIEKENISIEALISASAVGIYGAFNSERICDESTPPASDFVGSVCQKWEAAAEEFSSLRIRVVTIRTALVLGKKGGILPILQPLFKNKLGAILGTGNQYMPWIHLTDLCRIYLAAIENPTFTGPYNAATGGATTNRDFSKQLAKTYGYRIWLPAVPAFMLQIVLGKMSHLLLKGQQLSIQKLQNTGFQFRFSSLEKAFEDLLL